MKKLFLLCVLAGILVFSSNAQSPTVYCTFWNGTAEYMANLNFTTLTVDSIGKIPGSTSFPIAQANGYDAYRNRYYTISNQGLVAVNASTGIPDFTASQYGGDYKHLSYNSTTDLIYATRYNGTEEEYYQISPINFQIVNQGILNIGVPYFAVGFYGSDVFANEVIFQTSESTASIKTVNMGTGQVTRTITKPSYLANLLMATHDPLTDFYYAVGLRNTKTYLVKINKNTSSVDTVGIIPGATSVGLAGSAIDPVNRKFIYISNLGITVVSLDNPANTSVIPYPAGVSNVKGFQTNYFSAPIPRPQGSFIRSQFKFVESWLKDGVDVPNTDTQDFTPNESGNYSYRIRRPDGSTSVSSQIAFTVTSNQPSVIGSNVFFFQDRMQDKLILLIPATESSEVQIFNSNGACVKSFASTNKQVDIQTLPAGVYQMVVNQGSRQLKGRFIR
jgi:hypothetical protein